MRENRLTLEQLTGTSYCETGNNSFLHRGMRIQGQVLLCHEDVGKRAYDPNQKRCSCISGTKKAPVLERRYRHILTKKYLASKHDSSIMLFR